MGHEVILIPDFTLAIQLGIFLASWLVLHVYVFRPYVAVLEKRHHETLGLKEKAHQAEIKAATRCQEYEAFMKGDRRKISDYVDGQRKAHTEECQAMLHETREKESQKFQRARADIQAESEKVKCELTLQVSDLSSRIVSKLVGYSVHVPSVDEPRERELRLTQS